MQEVDATRIVCKGDLNELANVSFNVLHLSIDGLGFSFVVCLFFS